MTQLIYQLGASNIQALLAAAKVVVGNEAYSSSALPSTGAYRMDLIYEARSESFEALFSELSTGTISSVRIVPDAGNVVWLIAYPPRFDSTQHEWWDLTFEFKGVDYRPLFDRLRQMEELDFVAVSLDEGLDFEESVRVDATSFPWSDRKLVIASVRSLTHDAPEQTVARGPSYAELGEGS
jgi:hypothetical protein